MSYIFEPTKPTNAKQRRSRTRRQPLGKRIIPSERDYAILREIYRFGLISSDHLTAILKPKSEKRFMERLGDLFHETGWIDRPKQQWDRGRALQSHCIYALTNSGHLKLIENGPLPDQAMLHKRQSPGHRVPQFEHQLAICQFLAAEFIKTTLNSNNDGVQKRFVPVEEILRRRAEKDATKLQYGDLKVDWNERPHSQDIGINVSLPRNQHFSDSALKTKIIPDAIYGIEYCDAEKRQYRFFALEIERTTPLTRRSFEKSSTLKKLLGYRAAIHDQSYKEALGIPNLFPVFVARDEEHSIAIKSQAQNVLTKEECGMFRFVVMI